MEDFSFKKLRTIELHLGLIYIFFMYFLRTWVHYVGQCFILRAMNVPVTQFEPHWPKIYIQYGEWLFLQEIVVVIFGILSNSILFSLMILIGFMTKKGLNCFPRMFYKVICWYGIMTILDPIIVLITDCALQDFDNGDYFKFYNFYFKRGGSGLVGIYLTVFLMFGMITLNASIFYQYMIFIHMNGRILDLYKRLSGSMKSFFIPHDNEVSLKYIQWVVERAKKKNFILRSARQVVHDRKGIEQTIQFIHLYKYTDENQISRSRLFVKDQDGSICEVPQSKLLLRDDELQSLNQDIQSGKATAFGDSLGQVVEMLSMKLSLK